MVYYTEDLIHEINNSSEINFIAVAETYLHSIGINAYIRKKKAAGEELKGYILIVAHRITGRGLSEFDFEIAGTEIKVIEYSNCYRKHESNSIVNVITSLKESHQKTNCSVVNILWVIIDFQWYEIFSNIDKNYQLCFNLIDDGDGSYINPFLNETYMYIYEHRESVAERLKGVFSIFLACALRKVIRHNLEKSERYNNYCIFLSEPKNQFVPNTQIVEYYSDAFKYRGTFVDGNIIEKCNNAVVINSQCLVENRITDGKIDYELYSQVVDFAKELELKIAIKPHPREQGIEKYENLKIDVIPAKISQEALFANTRKKPKCVISIFSSTLLNAYGLFSIPVISLAKIFVDRCESKVVKNQIDDYIKRYKSVILFPESIEELQLLLEEIKDENN